MANSKIKELGNEIRKYEIKRKNIVPYIGTISIFVLNHKCQKSLAEDIEKELKDRDIIFKRDISEFDSYYDNEINILNEVNYMVVLVSKEFLFDWELTGILFDCYKVNEANDKIIPLITEEILYEPIERTKIINSLQDYINKYAKECFDEDYNGDVAEELGKMQSILKMIKDFLKFTLKRDKKSDRTLSQKIIRYLKYDNGIDVNERENKMVEDKNVTFNVNGGQVNVASGNATIHATQNNGINENELDDIIKGIMENLADLKKEDADEIVDVVEMAKNELAKPEPKASRLRNCLTLIAPMFTIANGIPTLVENLQKLQDFICLHIH